MSITTFQAGAAIAQRVALRAAQVVVFAAVALTLGKMSGEYLTRALDTAEGILRGRL